MRQTKLQLEQLSQLPLFIQLKNVGFDFDVWLEQMSLAMKNALTSGGSIVFNVLSGTLNGVFNTLIILVLTIFFLLGGKQFWSGIFSWLPEPWNQKIPVYIRESFQEYFTVRFILAAISSVARLVVFLLLGIPFATLFAFGIGLGSLIPFGGTVVALFAAIVISLNSLNLGLKFLISAVIIDQITDNVLSPKLMGGKIRLNPIWIIISLFIGAQIADILGVFLAIPVASVIKRIAEDIRKDNKAIKESEQAVVNQ